MTIEHGTAGRFYWHTLNMSGYTESVEQALERSAAEYRPLDAANVRRRAGARSASLNLAGGAMDNTVDAAVWSAFNTEIPLPFAYLPFGDALGRLAYCGQSIKGSSQRTAGDDIVRIPLAKVSTGRVDHCVVLRPLGAGGISPGAAVDGGAATANGGAGYLLCTATSGTLDVTIEHSADGETGWDALATFEQLDGTPGSEVVEVAAETAVRQFLRATWAIEAGEAATFFVAFGRR